MTDKNLKQENETDEDIFTDFTLNPGYQIRMTKTKRLLAKVFLVIILICIIASIAALISQSIGK